jgi:hypothetical protein
MTVGEPYFIAVGYSLRSSRVFKGHALTSNNQGLDGLGRGVQGRAMVRPTRVYIKGGWYHVVNRGIEKRSIFRGSSGYEHFIRLLSILPKRFGLRLHVYVLMPNHYHLQVGTPQANLSRATQWLNVSYSI